MLRQALPGRSYRSGASSQDAMSAEHMGQHLSGRTVLIVEDELLTGISLRMDAERYGAVVIGPTATLQGTRTAISDASIDVAILDVQLTDAEVFPVADQLYNDRIPIIFHTGHANEIALNGRYPHCRVFTKATASAELLRAAALMLACNQNER